VSIDAANVTLIKPVAGDPRAEKGRNEERAVRLAIVKNPNLGHRGQTINARGMKNVPVRPMMSVLAMKSDTIVRAAVALREIRTRNSPDGSRESLPSNLKISSMSPPSRRPLKEAKIPPAISRDGDGGDAVDAGVRKAQAKKYRVKFVRETTTAKRMKTRQSRSAFTRSRLGSTQSPP
jgi:hypothetical protein